MTTPNEHQSQKQAVEAESLRGFRLPFEHLNTLARYHAIGVPLFLALLPFLLFWPLTLVRETFYLHDVQHYFYPYHIVSANMVRSGTLPLWNPYAFSGIPLIGDGQTAMFYPPNWLFFILPGAAALNYVILLQFSIAGVGMYLCALGFGLRRLAGFTAALAFMFCGFMTARIIHLSIMSGVALIPLLVLCVDRAIVGDSVLSSFVSRLSSRRWFVAAALMAALHAVSGHPQVPVYTAAALGMLSLVRLAEVRVVSGRWLPALLVPLRLAGIYILGYALAAIQLVPWVELGAASPRAAGASFEFVMGTGSHGPDWLLFLFPYLFGVLKPNMFGAEPMGIATAVRAWEHSVYVGLPTLALALVGVGAFVELTVKLARSRSSPSDSSIQHRWFTLLFLFLLVILALVTGAGKYTPFSQLVYAAPVLGKLRDVERALALAAFGLPLLAGFGMQRLLDRRAHSHAIEGFAMFAALLVGATVVFWAWFSMYAEAAVFLGVAPANLARLALNPANIVVPLLLALGTQALIIAWAFSPRNRTLPLLLCALVLVDMAMYATSYHPTTDARLYAYRPRSLQALDGDGQPFRKATVLLNDNNLPNQIAQESLAVSWSMVYGVEDINGFNSLQPRRYTDYLFGPQVADVSYGYLPNEALFQPESPILSSLNVRYLMVPQGGSQPQLGSHLRLVAENAQVRVYENTLVWPRAFFSEQVRVETNPQIVLNTVTAPNFDGRKLALVETNQPLSLPTPASAASARVSAQTPNRISVATQTNEPRLLVLSEMYFPGWHAYVDNAEMPMLRTNYLFRGVVVPAGQHTVTFVYRPLSVIIGAVVSALAAVAMVVMVVRRRG